MSNPTDGFPVVGMLKEVLGPIKSEAKRMIFLPMIRGYIKLHIEKNINGDIPVIGVFGPYENYGEHHLHVVCQKIAARGCIALMGEGYYHPSDPSTLHPLTELFPDPVNFFLTLDDSPYFLYRSLLPSIIDGASIRLFPPRTQVYELVGCVERDIPLIGYLHDERVTNVPVRCPHLNQHVNSTLIDQQCTAKTYGNCPGNAPKPPYCPFLKNIYNIPWIQKRWFIESSTRTLFAVNDEDAMNSYLDELISITTPT